MLAASSTTVHAQARRDAAYEHAIGEAIRQFDAGRLPEARALFLRAHELKPSARTLRGLGVVELELGNEAAAYRLLTHALTDPRRPLARAQRKEVRTILRHLTPLLAHYRVVVVPEDASLDLDGTPAERAADGTLVLAPGDHTLVASAPGHEGAERQVHAVAGEAREIAIALRPVPPPPPVAITQDLPVAELAPAPAPLPAPVEARALRSEPPAPRRAGSWIALTSGGAVAVVGATLLALGLRDVRKVERARDGTEWSQLERAHDRAPLLTGAGIAATALGVTTAGIGVWMLQRGRRSERAPVHVALSPRSISLEAGF